MDVATHAEEIEAWLILLRASALGASALRALIGRCGGAIAALDAARRGDARIDDTCRAWLHKPDRARIADDVAWLGNDAHHLVTLSSEDYPPLLRDAAGAPPALFVVGDATALWQAQLAIVGSRNASIGGIDNARDFAHAACAAGLAITSGLAEGIDAAAHEAALDADATTIAVLGTGADIVYPKRHAALAARVASSGALVSEFPPGTPGKPEHFPRRNRIIAGLSLGTLVVEAGLRSGSLITARLATEQGRDVFAIPGSIRNPLARGCHALIRQGATLVETANEVIGALSPLAAALGAELRQRLTDVDDESSNGRSGSKRRHARGDATAPPRASGAGDDASTSALIAALGHDAVGVDTLADRTGLEASVVAALLLTLELDGRVAPAPGGLYLARTSR
jgi:DNA processing protein